jgi:hypothetical protein
MARNSTAAVRSEPMSTRRRSTRSPSIPANGAARPPTPIIASSAAETQSDDPVRS